MGDGEIPEKVRCRDFFTGPVVFQVVDGVNDNVGVGGGCRPSSSQDPVMIENSIGIDVAAVNFDPDLNYFIYRG